MQEAADTIIGRNSGLKEVFRTLMRVAPTESTVLVTGESGTGKELAVRFLHEQSKRKNGPLVPVNCGAIPRDLLESELFGHEKGAFTGAVSAHQGRFQAASHGTIFLDEIGELELPLQAKILRALQEQEIEPVGSRKPVSVDVRVVAATNRDLEQMVAQGLFREDLFYRLQVIPVHLPPLRERGSDILELARFFMHKFCTRDKRPELALSDEVCDIFMRYAWPGNVRELQNYMERMAVLVEGDLLTPQDLPAKVLKAVAAKDGQDVTDDAGAADAAPCAQNNISSHGPIAEAGSAQSYVQPSLAVLEEKGLGLKAFLEEIEMSLIQEALKAENGSQQKAASRLGIKRTTLIEKMRRKGLL